MEESERIRKAIDIVFDMVGEISYALLIIRRTLEEKNLLSYEDSYELRRAKEKIADLAKELEELTYGWVVESV